MSKSWPVFINIYWKEKELLSSVSTFILYRSDEYVGGYL